MLVLDRQRNKSITLVLPNGQLMTLDITDRDDQQMQISIEAPDNIKLVRRRSSNTVDLFAKRRA